MAPHDISPYILKQLVLELGTWITVAEGWDILPRSSRRRLYLPLNEHLLYTANNKSTQCLDGSWMYSTLKQRREHGRTFRRRTMVFLQYPDMENIMNSGVRG